MSDAPDFGSGFASPRPMTEADLDLLDEIDATIEPGRPIRVETGDEEDPLAATWRLKQGEGDEESAVVPNRLDFDRPHLDAAARSYRQVVRGMEEGVAAIIERDGFPIASAVAVEDVEGRGLRLVDLRVDYDTRREGYGTAMLFYLISAARERQATQETARGIFVELGAHNEPAQRMLIKSGFELVGIDLRRRPDGIRPPVLVWHLPIEG